MAEAPFLSDGAGGQAFDRAHTAAGNRPEDMLACPCPLLSDDAGSFHELKADPDSASYSI